MTAPALSHPIGVTHRIPLRQGWRHMKLSSAVERFLTDARLRGLASSTLIGYRSDLLLLVSLASVHAADSVLAFTPELVRQYFLQLSAKGLVMGTLHRRRASLSEFAKWGLRQRFWAENPMVDIPRIRRPHYLPRPFSGEELERLMALDLPLEERTLRGLLYYTGLRVTPIGQLRIGDLSFSPTTFPNGLQVPGSIRALSKGGRTSVKPMHPDLWALLRDYYLQGSMDAKAFLFAQRGGRPFSRKMIARRTRQWGRAAGVAQCLPHRFRHTFATDLLEQGADIRLIQALLDHEDLSTTALYLKVKDERTATVVMRLKSFTKGTADRPDQAPGVDRQEGTPETVPGFPLTGPDSGPGGDDA